ncbi:hypothetical protein AVEN_29460-1 [Araneus ventricosus]|uniref:Uncharacterized protein n=1 Tax=Araneus ventricosus TaxID=182803 RepID=A0A4Y2WR40_ARAVE|nr:hypothetical protein AVEN_182013-1 [Araneus ventricosus]GBO39975.1 hypothetical protein AVEN_138549-1 [Araneus ventricosus]GBO39977.1 hypothetical protein AVEN_167119-1 [Araneus ventricosus]GBO40062.1 hypothetical protein AVEN_29460-1 [Araneus ventricosus]
MQNRFNIRDGQYREPPCRIHQRSWLVTWKTESSCSAVASRNLNDSGRYDSSSTKAGVLVAHHRATARPLPKEVRTITGGGTRSPPLLCPRGRRLPACLSGSNSYPCTRGVPLWGYLG